MASILIAEDDPLISSFVEKGLRAAGHTTRLAQDGEEATRLGLTDDFDLLILDMALPKREGIEVLRELRARGNDVPVIVLTGRPEMRDAVSALDVELHDFMTKPFRFEELLARIRARVQLAGVDATAAPTDPLTHELDTAPRESAEPQSDAALRRDEGWRGS